MLKNMSIRTKQILAVVPLVAALIFYGGLVVMEKWETYLDMDRTEDVVELAVKVGELVYELQKERGMSAGYLNSDGQKFATQLPSQRQKVDMMLAAVYPVLQDIEEEFGEVPGLPEYKKVFAHLKHLKTWRQQIDALRMPTQQMVKNYSSVIQHLADAALIGLKENANHDELVALGFGYYAFLITKEQMGIMRAIGAAVFTKKSISLAQQKKLAELFATRKNFLHLAEISMPPTLHKALASLTQTPQAQQMDQLIQLMLKSTGRINTEISAENWFQLATHVINQYKTFEDKLEKTFIEKTEVIKAAAYQALILQSLLLVFTLLFGLVFSWRIIRKIQSQLNTITETANRIAEHADLTLRLPADGKDELHQISHAFNHMLGRIQQLVADVLNISGQVDQAGSQLADAADNTKGSMLKQHDAVKQIYNNIQQMVQAINTISQHIESVKHQADEALKEGRTAQQQTSTSATQIKNLAEEIEQTARVVTEVEQRSQEISGVLDIIRDISEQTNLLALNAAIEAARAGEHGRGFAVVADEVRSLAVRTQQSTEEIQAIIERLKDETARASQAMQHAETVATDGVTQMQQVQTALNAILHAIEATVNANEETVQIGHTQQKRAQQAKQNADTVQALADEAQANTEQVYKATQTLKQLAHHLKEKARLFRT